jgi:hypothetical protein
MLPNVDECRKSCACNVLSSIVDVTLTAVIVAASSTLMHGPCGGRMHPFDLADFHAPTLQPHLYCLHIFKNMARFSGIQRDVLSLYRQCLRALKEKPNVCVA